MKGMGSHRRGPWRPTEEGVRARVHAVANALDGGDKTHRFYVHCMTIYPKCVDRVGSTWSADIAACPASVQLHPRPVDCSSRTRNQDPWLCTWLRCRHSRRVSSGAGCRPTSSHHQSSASVNFLVQIFSLYLEM